MVAVVPTVIPWLAIAVIAAWISAERSAVSVNAGTVVVPAAEFGQLLLWRPAASADFPRHLFDLVGNSLAAA